MDKGGGASWSAHAADLIQWFQLQQAELPVISFLLNVWTSVSTPVNFYAALGRDIAQGPQGPRAAALVGDLEDLFALWSRERGARDPFLGDTQQRVSRGNGRKILSKVIESIGKSVNSITLYDISD